ncbi:MAG: 50S ribosomal protein L10 [Bifidobacteriaceae bacterium]|jgi:large subunit ribosomal protein L10|nr:50S ribosomal protein L10 [Bifidobacteriaceae bacterium]
MARPDKVAAVEEIRRNVAQSEATMLTEYRGLTVADLKALRQALGGGATYSVVKNTLAKIAIGEEGVTGLDEALTGSTAVAYVRDDPVAAAKVLREFARTHRSLVIKGGIFEGRALTAEDVGKLADMDSRDVTLAKLAGVLKASLFQAARLFAAPASQAVRTIDALREKQESAA